MKASEMTQTVELPARGAKSRHRAVRDFGNQYPLTVNVYLPDEKWCSFTLDKGGPRQYVHTTEDGKATTYVTRQGTFRAERDDRHDTGDEIGYDADSHTIVVLRNGELFKGPKQVLEYVSVR